MLKKIKLDWPQVTLAGIAIAAFVAVYLLAPDERDTIEKGVLAVWAFLSTFLGPAIRRRLEGEGEGGGDE